MKSVFGRTRQERDIQWLREKKVSHNAHYVYDWMKAKRNPRDHYVWPGITTIAKGLRMHARDVKRAIRELVEKKVIKRERLATDKRKNCYRLLHWNRGTNPRPISEKIGGGFQKIGVRFDPEKVAGSITDSWEKNSGKGSPGKDLQGERKGLTLKEDLKEGGKADCGRLPPSKTAASKSEENCARMPGWFREKWVDSTKRKTPSPIDSEQDLGRFPLGYSKEKEKWERENTPAFIELEKIENPPRGLTSDSCWDYTIARMQVNGKAVKVPA